jgi:hypothetical protein
MRPVPSGIAAFELPTFFKAYNLGFVASLWAARDAARA